MFLQSRKNLFLLIFLFCGFKSNQTFGLESPQTDEENANLYPEEKDEIPTFRIKSQSDETNQPILQPIDETPNFRRISAENDKLVSKGDSKEMRENSTFSEPPKKKKIHRRRLTSKKRKFDGIRKKLREYIDDNRENPDKINPFRTWKEQNNIKDLKNLGLGANKKPKKNSKTKTLGDNKSARRIVNSPDCPPPIDIRIEKSASSQKNPSSEISGKDESGRRIVNSPDCPPPFDIRMEKSVDPQKNKNSGLFDDDLGKSILNGFSRNRMEKSVALEEDENTDKIEKLKISGLKNTEEKNLTNKTISIDSEKKSSAKKKGKKHRRRGEKKSQKIKENSRRNLNNGRNLFDKMFVEKRRPGRPVIYSEKAEKLGDAKPAKYNGIDKKPTASKSAINLRPQLRKMKSEPEMEYLHYDTIIRSRYAKTTVTGKLKNYGKARDINVNIILPHRALITEFQTFVDGFKTVAVVRGKNKTTSLPKASVTGENIGTILVETRDCDAVAVSIPVPKDGSLNYTVTYEYLLQRNLDVYSVPITVHNNAWIEDLMVTWRILEERNITILETPLIHKTTALPLEGSDDPMVCILNDDPGITEVVWRPTISEQKNISRDLGQISNRGVVGVLELKYDIDHDQDPCGQVVRQDGVFAQFFTAPNQPPLAKHVVFILDASDSMQGDPIKQLKKAMLYILDTLQPMDNFTLIDFSDEVNIMNIYDRSRDTIYRSVGEGTDGRGKKSGKTSWPGNLETYEATPNNIKAAKEAVKMMQLRVFTNIYDALIMGFKSVKDISSLPPAQSGQPHPEPIIIFLTDGHASDGPSYDHDTILKMVEDQNHITKATMFALGFGGEADMGLLRRFALATNGIEKHIYKDIDAADQLVKFFQSIKAPILKDVFFKYNSKQVIAASLTGQSFPMIHRGKEVIIAGRLDPTYPDKASLYVDVAALGRYAMIRCERTSGAGSRRSMSDIVLTKYSNATTMKHVSGNRAIQGLTAGTVERIWAFLTLSQLRDEVELDHFATHQDTRFDDTLRPLDKMLKICLRLNYAMPAITDLVYNKTVIDRISISPESADQIEETTQSDPLAPFPWILKLRDKHGFAKLPITNKKKGRMYTYLSLGVNENPPPPRSCADGLDGSPGVCRYLPDCPDPKVLGTPQKFRLHFCRLGSFAGVCCSDSALETSRAK